MGDDSEKTVFGQSLPGGRPRKPRAGPDSGPDRTMFGAPVPGGGAPRGRGAVPDDPWDVPGPGSASGPGAAPQRPAAPAPQPAFTPRGGAGGPRPFPAAGGPMPGGPIPGGPMPGGPMPSGPASRRPMPASPIFPDPPAARARPAPQRARRRVPLAQALASSGYGRNGASNPLIGAAASLLILLGRLRSGLVEVDAALLMEHVVRDIQRIHAEVLEAGVPQEDVHDTVYALAATADDIVLNLPDVDKTEWRRFPMVPRFFGEQIQGEVFFERLDWAMQAPGQRYDVLELMYVCLSLGFEGVYRASPHGGTELDRRRRQIHDTLRRVRPRPGEALSVKWEPVELGGRLRFGGPPTWVVASIAAGMVLVGFVTLSTLLNGESSQANAEILALHADDAQLLEIERTPLVRETSGSAAAPPPEPAPSSQLARIRERLAPEIAAGDVVVLEQGDFIIVRVGEALRFALGSARLSEDFTPLATRIGAALVEEPGQVRIVGHTDNIGRPASNAALSAARAETVKGVLSAYIPAERMETVGMGSAQPLPGNTNSTPEEQAANRRVEIMIAKVPE